MHRDETQSSKQSLRVVSSGSLETIAIDRPSQRREHRHEDRGGQAEMGIGSNRVRHGVCCANSRRER